jgi:hypothetical protein
MHASNIATIREMIASGASDQDIASAISILEDEQRAFDAEIEDFHEKAFGSDPDHGMSDRDVAYCDRLDMGRNDAGEWLGFM